jgi:hypothetical protein
MIKTKSFSLWLLYEGWIEEPLNPLPHFICKLILSSRREILSLTDERVEDQVCEGQTSKKHGAKNWFYVFWQFNLPFFPLLTANIMPARAKKSLVLGIKNGWVVFSTEHHHPKKLFCMASRHVKSVNLGLSFFCPCRGMGLNGTEQRDIKDIAWW